MISLHAWGVRIVSDAIPPVGTLLVLQPKPDVTEGATWRLVVAVERRRLPEAQRLSSPRAFSASWVRACVTKEQEAGVEELIERMALEADAGGIALLEPREADDVLRQALLVIGTEDEPDPI